MLNQTTKPIQDLSLIIEDRETPYKVVALDQISTPSENTIFKKQFPIKIGLRKKLSNEGFSQGLRKFFPKDGGSLKFPFNLKKGTNFASIETSIEHKNKRHFKVFLENDSGYKILLYDDEFQPSKGVTAKIETAWGRNRFKFNISSDKLDQKSPNWNIVFTKKENTDRGKIHFVNAEFERRSCNALME